MTTYKNRLPPSALMGYISPAPYKTGAGFRSLLTVQAHNRASGFFTCKASSRLFALWRGVRGSRKARRVLGLPVLRTSYVSPP
ncbi:TPA: hypothetical protein G8L97_000785 [Salmonella enterica]|uniref:Ash family protein n=1 Tax=Salmonella enterica TaxID=28901 RepID=A0A748BLB0_SALER|nr:hypothetical protein [Salmonella enterica]